MKEQKIHHVLEVIASDPSAKRKLQFYIFWRKLTNILSILFHRHIFIYILIVIIPT